MESKQYRRRIASHILVTVVVHHLYPLFVRCHVACLLCEKRNGGGGSLTLTNVNSDNDMRHHRLDDVARLLMCHVVFIRCCCCCPAFVIIVRRHWLPHRWWRRGPASHVNKEEGEGGESWLVLCISRPPNHVRKLLCNLRTLKLCHVNIVVFPCTLDAFIPLPRFQSL